MNRGLMGFPFAARNNYTVRTQSYTAAGTYTFKVAASGFYVVDGCAGGGGGSSNPAYGGGGGAMSVVALPLWFDSGDALTITVGAAGTVDGNGGNTTLAKNGTTILKLDSGKYAPSAGGGLGGGGTTANTSTTWVGGCVAGAGGATAGNTAGSCYPFHSGGGANGAGASAFGDGGINSGAGPTGYGAGGAYNQAATGGFFKLYWVA